MAYYSYAPAEAAFHQAGPICHLYTKPLETDILFTSDEERSLALNYIAIARYESNCVVLCYSIMTNHFHFILNGSREQVLSFYERLIRLLNNYYSRHGRGMLAQALEPGITPIKDIRQLRNEIAYVIRNAFVVNPNTNVFADPWSSGFLYFNPTLIKAGVSAACLKGRGLRDFVKSRTITQLDERIYVKDGVAQAWSFVDYERVMRFYDNARQYVFSVTKNVEALAETALRYGELPSLDDSELRPTVFALCRERLNADKPGLLDEAGQKRLAIMLKNKYCCSNKQLSRLIGLPLKTVDAMFPLAGTAQNR